MAAKPIINENLSRFEKDLPKNQIVKLTPYLNDITIPGKAARSKPRKLTAFQKAFSWYYVFNNNNKADAYKRAKYGRYDKKLDIIQIVPPEWNRKTPFASYCCIEGLALFNLPYIQQAIHAIREHHINNVKVDLPQTFIEQLTIQSTYDPSMFIDVDGEAKFQDWEEIPFEYRCCVEGIEKKYYGKDADRKVVILKLVDRSKARRELYQFAENLILNPEQLNVIHKTINQKGEEVGLDPMNFDPKNMSTEKLQSYLEKIQEAKVK